jgi:hypothetical protein
MNNKNYTYDPFKLLTLNNLQIQEYERVKNCDYSQKLYEDFYNLFISFNDLSKTVLERISLLPRSAKFKPLWGLNFGI